MPYFVGILALVIIWLLYWAFCKDINPLHLVIGADGKASSSKFQFLLWTCMVIFAYVAIYYVKATNGDYGPFSEMPSNLLILMGISAGSMVASKVITSSQITQGTTQKDPVTTVGNKKSKFLFKYLVCDDDGYPALNQVQMIAWTFISLGIYLALVIEQVNSGSEYHLPNVDESLMVLMGISQAAYLGKKLSSTTNPNLQNLNTGTAKVGDEIILRGQNFGGNQGGGQVKIFDPIANVSYYPSEITEWEDTSIKIKVPTIPVKVSYNVTVIVGSKETRALSLQVKS
jgi:hypothetical protein